MLEIITVILRLDRRIQNHKKTNILDFAIKSQDDEEQKFRYD